MNRAYIYNTTYYLIFIVIFNFSLILTHATYSDTCVNLLKNGVPSGEPTPPNAWSVPWGTVTENISNPQYSAELGWYDEIEVTVQDTSTPVSWYWKREILNDTVIEDVEDSGEFTPGDGIQTFTIIIPYPDPSCDWGAPDHNGIYRSRTTLNLSLCNDQTWEYTWDPTCPTCPIDFDILPEEVSYTSTSDLPPLDFPGYMWPAEGFEGMPEFMIPLESYFKSVFTTNGVEHAFPGFCLDIFTVLEYDAQYGNGDVRIHRSLNPDTDGDGYADVDQETGTTSNMLINMNGDIVGTPENLARVNYIVNQYYRGNYQEYGVTYAEIQAAIWDLLSIGQSADSGYSEIIVDPETGMGSGGLIYWDEAIKSLVVQDALQSGVEKFSPTNCELMGLIVQTGENRQTTIVMVPYCIYKCFESGALLVSTDEPYEDGILAHDFVVPECTDIIAAGTGLQNSNGQGLINIDVPGEVVRALLYWEGKTSYGSPHGYKDTIYVNDTSVTGILIGGPTKYTSTTGNGDIIVQSYRADVTSLITQGPNNLAIDNFNFNYPNSPGADGVGVLVVYKDPITGSETFIQDGQDLAYWKKNEPLKTSVPKTFTFFPADFQRNAKLVTFVGGLSCDSVSASEIVVECGGIDTILVNELGNQDGCSWDTNIIDVTIPAGASSLTVKMNSTNSNDPDAASLTWICTALSVPNPYCSYTVDGDIDEWDFTEDFYADMHRAGDPTKEVETKIYLKYDEVSETLFSLVTVEPEVEILQEPDNAFIKIDDVKYVDGTFGNDGVPSDFEWVRDATGTIIGWESSIPVSSGIYSLDAHTQVLSDGASQTAAVAYRNIPLLIGSNARPVLIAIDEDSIDNGNQPNLFTGTDVNDDIADIGVRDTLRYFANNVGQQISLFTGQVGDEGWFALKEIPSTWEAAGPTENSIMNYVLAGPGLGSPDAAGSKETLLDGIPKITPLRASALKMMEGSSVLAVVYDGDINVNYDPLSGSLKGANLGVVAFRVLKVTNNTGYSLSTLPKIEVEILDADFVKTIPLGLFTNAPEPDSASEPMDVDPDPGLKAYWSLDQISGTVANDESGNGNHGTLNNRPSWVPGRKNNALSFNGRDSYVDLGLIDITNSELTITGWIKANQFTHLTGHDARIISKSSSIEEQDHMWMLSTIESGGNTRFCFRLKTNGNTSTLIADSGNLETNVWVHVAAVYNGFNMILYKDGKEIGRTTKTGNINSAPDIAAWMGSNPIDANSRPFDGIIDEIKLYDRALSQSEIHSLASLEIVPLSDPSPTPTPFESPTPTPTPDSIMLQNLVGYWPMNEGSGNIVQDQSGMGNNGIFGNDPIWVFGKNGNALSFDGENDYVDVGNVDVTGSEMSISAWIKADRLNHLTGHDARIISKTTGTLTSDHYWMLSTIVVGSEDRLRFRLKSGDQTSTLVASSGNLSTNVWTHVVVTYDGFNMSIYKDGALVGQMPKTGNINSNNTIPVWIGANPLVPSDRPFDGIIDEVRIYERTLTQDEINILAGLTQAKIYNPVRMQRAIIERNPVQVLFTPTPTMTPELTPTPTITPTPILGIK